MKAASFGDNFQLRQDTNPAARALVGIAAVQLLAGLIGLFVYRSNPDIDMPELKWFVYHFQRGALTPLDWVVTFSGVFYMLLAVLAYRVRLPAVLAGVATYGALLLAQGAGAVWDAVVIKVIVVFLLILAFVVSFRRPLPPALSSGQPIRRPNHHMHWARR
jgi:hypothetical protein